MGIPMKTDDIDEYYELLTSWKEVRPYTADFPETEGRNMVHEREFRRLVDYHDADGKPVREARLVVEWSNYREILWYAIDGVPGAATTPAQLMSEITEKMA